jgi:IrrE N-terminal-like domain
MQTGRATVSKRTEVCSMTSSWPAHSFSEVPPLRTAESLALEIRSLTLGERGAEVARCDLDELCRLGRFFPRKRDMVGEESGHEALIVPLHGGGFDLLVDANPPGGGPVSPRLLRQRFRFRVAHEVGHSFFYDRRSNPPRRRLPGSAEEEAFCDRFASALLIPHSFVARRETAPEAIFAVQRAYDVSLEVAARAFAAVHSDITVLGLSLTRAGKQNAEALRIQWSAGTCFAPARARLGSTAAQQAFETGRGAANEQLQIGGLRGCFTVMAARSPRSRFVLAIARATEGVHNARSPSPREQLVLPLQPQSG